jgi:hypothetical protein
MPAPFKHHFCAPHRVPSIFWQHPKSLADPGSRFLSEGGVVINCFIALLQAAAIEAVTDRS